MERVDGRQPNSIERTCWELGQEKEELLHRLKQKNGAQAAYSGSGFTVLKEINMRERARTIGFLTVVLSIAIGSPSLFYGQGKGSNESSTRIKHVIVIFQENVSFDHYFGTYPHAGNPPGEIPFRAKPDTPKVNGLTFTLRRHNPNSSAPFRLSRRENYTCDQDHAYKAEQKAFDQGRMDRFPENTGNGGPKCPDYGHGSGLVMGYYDGNIVSALWNYAQYFAMSDAFFDTVFGPSTPGHLNLIAGQTSMPK